MRARGVELLSDLDTLAVMGLAEILRSLPSLLALRWRVWRFLSREEVDLVVPVDYPGFNLSLACRASDLGIPVLYYIAPQVWAWREGRSRKLARCADRVCVVLPFEEELLRAHGADARFVGHPLLDEAAAGELPVAADDPGGTGSGERGAGGRDGPRVLGLFPGSRRQEVDRLLEPFRAAARLVARDRPELRVLVARAPDLPASAYPGEGPDLRPAEEVLARADAAITKSGTVTLQLALAGVPMVVAYRMNPLTHRIARRLVEVDHIALVNLVAGRELVPELIQDEAAPRRLAEAVAPLLEPGGGKHRRIREGLAGVRDRLGSPGCAGRVADHAMELMAGSSAVREPRGAG
jgi:lipid-A-disaccharide synthase